MSSFTKYFQNRQAGYTDQYQMEFRYESDKGFYTIWCWEHPSDPYQKGEPVHHLGGDGKLCQKQGKESKSFEHAEAFAHWWMKRWSIYVRTGNFPMTSEKIDV